MFHFAINTNDLRNFLHLFAAKQVGVPVDGMIDEESPNANDKTNPDLIKKHQKIINEAFRANYSLVRQMTVRGRYGLSKFLLTYANEILLFDIAVTMIVAFLLQANHNDMLKLGTFSKVIHAFLSANLFTKAMFIIVMAFESLM